VPAVSRRAQKGRTRTQGRQEDKRTEVVSRNREGFDFKFMLNFVFFELVSLVWKSGSRFLECFTKVNGREFDVYCPLFPVVLNFHIEAQIIWTLWR
jgi:hypothetical protein